MTKAMLTVVLGALIIASTAHARLGETPEMCSKRYGEPVRVKLDATNTGVAVYDKNDLIIKIHFSKGEADLIHYSPGEVHRIDLDIAKELLSRNGRSKEWVQLTKTEETIYDVRDQNAQHPRTEMVDPIRWKTKDGVLVASFSNSKGTLEIKGATEEEKLLKDL